MTALRPFFGGMKLSKESELGLQLLRALEKTPADSAAARALVDEGADVNIRGQKGNSVLILAIFSQDAALVGAMLARGARTDWPNDAGKTAFQIAAEQGGPAGALVTASVTQVRGTGGPKEVVAPRFRR